MATETKCPHCGKPVPATALQGICPECLLKAGVADTGEIGPDGTVVGKSPSSSIPRIEDIAPHFPQLEILECLGRGGMGAVYKARQPKLDRLVALKILTRGHACGITDTEFAARFQQEARALARLSHPDIVAVYDFGEAGGFHYLLMEFVDGLTLRQLLQTRKLSPEQALTIVPKICEALQFAHERGIVHRDIKPENILLDKQGQVKIADFGIAKILGTDAAGGNLTGAKDVMGTPHYMAPEQIEKPTKVDHRADIYSLGVVFYEMLTGELPLGNFQSPSKKVHVDVRLDEVVLHALEKEPDRRYQHASEVKTDVEKIASTTQSRGLQQEQSPAARDAVWFSTNLLPELLPGEQVLHFQKRLWAVFNKSLPTYRFFFSLPPLWSAGLYITDRRVLLIAHFFGLAQKFSIWFPSKAPDSRRERLKTVSIGESGLLGKFLQLDSEDYKDRWYRGRELMLRFYLRQPGSLRDKILEAQSSAKATTPVGAAMLSSTRVATAPSVQPLRGWVPAARWTARVFSILLLAFYGVFILAEGLPAIAAQPEGVQLNFVALGLMLAGFVVGWKREGTAALLIASGWTLWQISEGRIRSNFFLTPLPVVMLYCFCWWATRGRRTGVVAAAVAVLSVLLGLGSLFCPTSVFVRGTVNDATTGLPIADARLGLAQRDTGIIDLANNPNARTGQDGRFKLYVGWYSPEKRMAVFAPGFATLETNLGPRSLGQRNVSRNFVLRSVTSPQPGGETQVAIVPAVVIETFPVSGTTDVDSALTELRVTFSKPMRDGGWSWVKVGDETFPTMTATPHFLADNRTCVLPVKLRPGKLYAVWLNHENARNFQDAEGKAALPYLLIFQTGQQ